MAIANSALSVGTTSASTIVAMPANTDYSQQFWIANNGSQTLFLGDTGVAASTGFPLAAGSFLAMTLEAGAVVCGLTTGGTTDVRILNASGSNSPLRRFA